jgi:(2Fe-2S) ferredoxin
MSYYEKHLYFCTNLRTDGRKCCAQGNAENLRLYAKTQIRALGRQGKGKVRINSAGCMDRCNEGPTLVVYPDAVWYRYETPADIDEIINEHILNNRIVDRLLLPE